jgi:hypothetical protein
LAAANFWSWDYAGSSSGTDLWNAVANFSWPVEQRPKDIVERLEDALNAGDIDAILALYQPNAVHITAERTIKGHDELRVYYAKLLGDMLPDATYDLTAVVSEGSSRHVSWNATSPRLFSVTAGQDTLGLRQGLIQYHSSLYQIVAG